MLFATRVGAQRELVYAKEHVVSVSFIDYVWKSFGDSCLVKYVDSCDHLKVEKKHIYENTEIYNESLKEIQYLLDEIGNNRIPCAEDMDINISVLKKNFNRNLIRLKYYELFLKPDKKECDSIINRYQTIDAMNVWLKKKFPLVDDGFFVINTAHDPYGMRIIIQTDKELYYFDMRDIEKFQPYLMRSSNKESMKFLTNFNVNKHIRNLYGRLKIHRNIPWKNDVIDLYIISCAEEYRSL